MDGTLVDTEPYWFAAEREVVARFGHGEWSDELSLGMVGFDLLDGARYLQTHGGVDLDDRAIVELLLDSVTARLRRRIPWRPGARELLAELRTAGVPCGLVTMSWRRFVDPVLDALPPGSFDAVVVGDEIPLGEGKPHPTPYRLGAAACGARTSDCIAIEDSPTGVTSALAAGCRVVGVPNVRTLEPTPGLTIIDSLTDVDLAVLRSLGGPVPPRSRLRTAALAGFAAITVALTSMALTGGDDAPLPPAAVPIDVWAPYWALDESVPDLGRRLTTVREVSPFFYEATGVESIDRSEYVPDALADRFLAESAGSARLVPSILDAMPAGGMASVLADPATRRRHIATIVDFAEALEADGIDIDYEQFAFSDGRDTWAATRPNWVAFVAELAEELHDAGRTLTVSIPPVYDETTTGDRGYWVYDHGAIAEHVDALRIMAYDYSFAEPGPIAPLAWIDEVIAGVSLAVAPEHHSKLVLGIPAYGSNWVVSTVGECPATAEGRTNVTPRSVDELAARRSATPVFDDLTGEWSFGYSLTVDDGISSCTQVRQVHWVDAEGAADRVLEARRAGWGGVSLWALGYEDDAYWDALVSATTRPL
jgi:HAD superfamily hydrolase (TIGR01509 family)